MRIDSFHGELHDKMKMLSIGEDESRGRHAKSQASMKKMSDDDEAQLYLSSCTEAGKTIQQNLPEATSMLYDCSCLYQTFHANMVV